MVFLAIADTCREIDDIDILREILAYATDKSQLSAIQQRSTGKPKLVLIQNKSRLPEEGF